MAIRVDDFSPRKTGRRSKYPWDKWANGQKWLIEPSDFPGITLESFRATAHGWAHRKGLNVTTQIDLFGRGIYVEFRRPVRKPKPKPKPRPRKMR